MVVRVLSVIKHLMIRMNKICIQPPIPRTYKTKLEKEGFLFSIENPLAGNFK